MTWQPIETAPTNGRSVLVVMDGHPTMARWDEQRHYAKPKPYWVSERGWLFGKKWDREHQPTHWMPLPEPPK